MTPHISAQKGEIAKTVLMAGDPLRAKFMAETFLEKPKLVNTVRNMLMYTGTYKGKEVTIAGSGMGQPSIGIYSYELFSFYDVDNIIRIGSTGSYDANLDVYEVVLVTDAYTDSPHYGKAILNVNTPVMEPSSELTAKLAASAERLGIKVTKGRTHSCEAFYSEIPLEEIINTTKAICVEMESYALFTNAKKFNKHGAAILTVSDNLITKAMTSSAEREQKFVKMVEIALGVL